MKIALAAAAFAFSASSAFAMCADKNVSASIDAPMTVASAEPKTTPAEPATDEVTTGSVEDKKAE